MVSMLTLNIGAASEERAHRILGWLADRPEEVFILTETSDGPGTELLLDRFTKAGWSVVHTPSRNRDRGVAIASRIATVAPARPVTPEVSIPGRAAHTLLDTTPQIGVLGVYVPSRDTSSAKIEKKREFVTSLVSAVTALASRERDRLVIGGDYNVISRTHQPLHPGFLPFEFGLLDHLADLGFDDPHSHSDQQEYSWVGRAEGYRYDYFHAGAALASRITGSAYLAETRTTTRITDHSALTLSLDLEEARTLETGDPSVGDTPTLF